MSSLRTQDLVMGRYLDGWYAGEDIFPDLWVNRACFKEYLAIKARGEAEDHCRVKDLKFGVEVKVKELLASKKQVEDLCQIPQVDLEVLAGEESQFFFKNYLIDKARSEVKEAFFKVGRKKDDVGAIRPASRRVVGSSKRSLKRSLAERRRLTPSRKMRISRRKYEVAMAEALRNQSLVVEARHRFPLGGTRFTVSFDTMEFMLARFGDNVMAAGNFKMGGECQDTDSLFNSMNARWEAKRNLGRARKGDHRDPDTYLVDILNLIQDWLAVQLAERILA